MSSYRAQAPAAKGSSGSAATVENELYEKVVRRLTSDLLAYAAEICATARTEAGGRGGTEPKDEVCAGCGRQLSGAANAGEDPALGDTDTLQEFEDSRQEKSSARAIGKIVRLTVPQCPERLRISPWTLYGWVSDGKLTERQGLRRIGRRRFIDIAEISAAISRGELGA